MRDFKVPTVPTTSNKSIRFPDDVIEQVEAAIKGKNSSFSAFVVEATKLALDILRSKNELK